MLKSMRQEIKHLRWVLWLVVASFIITIFVSWGMGGQGGGRGSEGWAAKVGDDVVTERQFYEAFQRQEEMLRQMLGSQYSRATFMNPDLVLDGLVDRVILLREARLAGVEATPGEVAERIRAIPAFQDPAGGFDIASYREFLRNTGLTSAKFERDVADDVVAGKMQDLLRSGVTVSEAEVREAWAKENESATIDYVLFPLEAYLPAVTVTDADVQAWFQAHGTEYDAGPARSVRWARFDRQAAQARLENETEMRARYEQDLATAYTVGPDQRRASVVVLDLPETAPEDERAALRAKAEEIAGRAQAGEDFAALAREHSQDPRTKAAGGDLGPFYRGTGDPVVEEAAFSMSEGEIRGPLETASGFVIVKLTKGEGEQPRTFEDVRELVARSLYAEAAGEQARSALEKFRKAHAEGKGIEAAAAEAGVTLSAPIWIARGEPVHELGPDPSLGAAAFALAKGEISEPLPAEGGQVILTVVDQRDSSPLSLEDAREAVEADVREDAARRLARADADALVAAAGASGDLAQAAAGRTVEQAGPFRRGDVVGGVGDAPELNRAAFATPQGELGPTVDTPGGPVVFRVTAKVELDESAYEAARSTTRRQLEERAFQSFRQASMDRLREAYEGQISINDEILRPFRPATTG